MTKLQLENSKIIVGVDFTNNKRVNEILAKEKSSSFLLYPGKDNFNLSIRESSEIISVVILKTSFKIIPPKALDQNTVMKHSRLRKIVTLSYLLE